MFHTNRFRSITMGSNARDFVALTNENQEKEDRRWTYRRPALDFRHFKKKSVLEKDQHWTLQRPVLDFECLTKKIRAVNWACLTRTRTVLYPFIAGKKIEKCHTGTTIPRPYPRPWRVGSRSINFIPKGYGSEFGSIFHYKGLSLGLGVPRGSGPVYTSKENQDRIRSALDMQNTGIRLHFKWIATKEKKTKSTKSSLRLMFFEKFIALWILWLKTFLTRDNANDDMFLLMCLCEFSHFLINLHRDIVDY
ncbi:hypothetical protein M9H77_04393 [Catharanthus roseus]|uniref:Uncharacterized protein n=1 Tax=Catharanthus roseus TaxID=4058 RepID=A0ACC0CE11_CATRO|nr:hypothetical protein M9H77_04393 [Catharanthus roseus]